MSKRKKDASHVRMGSGNGEMVCRNCGDTHAVVMPCSIDMWSATVEAFIKRHYDCTVLPGSPASLDGKDGMTPDQWLASGDTGISSKTIWSVMTGREAPGDGSFRGSPPRDPDDFGRCYRLLERFPAWRARLREVSKAWPAWARLIEEWTVLEAMYLADLPKGSSPRLYERMQELRTP